MRSCKGPWIGLVAKVERIAARFKWTIPVTFQIPWGTMPLMPSTITIRGLSTKELLAISILLQSPLILTQVSVLNNLPWLIFRYDLRLLNIISCFSALCETFNTNVFVHETLLIWFEIWALQLISLCFCSMVGHGSCKFEFLPWIKYEVISFLTVKKVMQSVLVLGCVSLNSWCSRCSISWCESKLIYHAKMAFILLLDSVNGQEMVLFSCTWKDCGEGTSQPHG